MTPPSPRPTCRCAVLALLLGPHPSGVCWRGVPSVLGAVQQAAWSSWPRAHGLDHRLAHSGPQSRRHHSGAGFPGPSSTSLPMCSRVVRRRPGSGGRGRAGQQPVTHCRPVTEPETGTTVQGSLMLHPAVTSAPSWVKCVPNPPVTPIPGHTRQTSLDQVE